MNVAESNFFKTHICMSLDCIKTVAVTPGMQEHSTVD